MRANKVNKVSSAIKLALCTGVLTGQLAINANAEEASNVTEKEIEVITVEATRRIQPLSEVPTSLTLISPDDAIVTGITDINGIAGLVPNLTAVDGGSPGLGNLTIRGVYAGGASTVGIYVDDIPYGPVIGGGGNSLALDASLLDLEHIEVLRGPQGTLFGASSMGGVVRYITKEPIADSFEGYVSADVSSTDKGGTNTIVRGSVTIPIIDEVLGVTISGFKEDADGYTDLPLLEQTDVNESDFSGGAFNMLYQPTEEFKAVFKYITQEAEYGDAGYEAFDPSSGETILGDFEDITASPTSREYTFDLTALTLEYDFGWAKLKSITSDQKVELDNVTDLTPTLGPIADALAPGGAPHTVAFNAPLSTERFTQEFHLTSQNSAEFEWIVGLYYTDQDSDTAQVTSVTPNDIELLAAYNPTKYEESAVFGNFTYYFSEKFDVTAGIRYSETENSIEATGTGVLLPPGSLPDGTVQEDELTNYLVNARYRFDNDVNFYARAASGFRPGGANLVFNIGGTTIGEPFYESDELWSYEFGFKGTLAKTLSWDIGTFFVDWRDAQLQGLNPLTGLNYFANSQGDVEINGIEAAIQGELFENFVISATVGWVDSEFTDDEPVIFAAKGEGTLAPEVTASFSADYIFDLFSNYATVGFTWRYTGEQDTSYDGGIAEDGTPIVPPFTNYKNDPYSQLDLRATYELEPVTISLYATNITNEDAYSSVFHIAPTYAQGLVLRPRTVGMNIKYQF